MDIDIMHCHLAVIFLVSLIVYTYLRELLYFGIFLTISFLFSTTNVAQMNLDILGLFMLDCRVIRNANNMSQWDLIYDSYSDMTHAIRALLQKLAFGGQMNPENPGAEVDSYQRNRERWNDY